jgi:type II secretory pathway pseudopilin PulG
VSTLGVIIVIAVLVIIVLIAGGIYATGVRGRRRQAQLKDLLEDANRSLALARAQDKGWDRSAMEAAARAAFAQRSPVDVRELDLVQVVDRPGSDDDQAVFRIVTDHGAEYVHLGRRGDT